MVLNKGLQRRKIDNRDTQANKEGKRDETAQAGHA
jgi:hypothetical protein